MQTIYVSNKGEDKNNGLTSETPVLSWKRLQVLCKGSVVQYPLIEFITEPYERRLPSIIPSPAKQQTDDDSPNGDD
jgi:hypothetical protein